jgi:DNA-directed RNA polymerase subunit E"
MTEKACKTCHFVSNGFVCPICKSTNLSDDWSGLVVVMDATASEVAKKMGIKSAGRYALRVR